MASIPTEFLFRFRFTCRRFEDAPTRKLAAEALSDEFRIPVWSLFPTRGALDVRAGDQQRVVGVSNANKNLFDFRCGWSEKGLLFTVVVAGKGEQGFWTHSTLHSADVLRVCVDTRDLRDAHRGTRFCHKFAFYPFVGESLDVSRPLAQWLPINRAREIPNRVDVDSFMMASERRPDGYAFSAFLPAASLTGYDPGTFNRFGLHYAVVDSKHGVFSLQHGMPFPFEDDPSLWSSFVMDGANPE